jgi:hypothetical protein
METLESIFVPRLQFDDSQEGPVRPQGEGRAVRDVKDNRRASKDDAVAALKSVDVDAFTELS